MFPGSVYGPMSELYEPSQKKYTTAVHSALGKFLECIVVDTFDTAKVGVVTRGR